jgi:hypothetical protein
VASGGALLARWRLSTRARAHVCCVCVCV